MARKLIEKPGAERLLKTEPKYPIDVKFEECTKSNLIYKGFAGKLFVIPRVNFEHPSSNYQTNPNGKANRDLLNRYDHVSRKKKEMIKLIHEWNSEP